jgi:uncharacterized protein (TIGR04141 family)
MPRKPKLQKLTISLLKAGTDRRSALRNPDDLFPYLVPSIDAQQDSLFTSSRPPTPPSWKSYLAEHVDGELEDLRTASSSGVLLFEASGRLFAATFGHGRHLLDLEALESDFGLRVVLNSVAPDQLKSVDAKTIDETTVHTRRDVSRDSALSAFGLDLSQDLLRAVTGAPRDETLAHRLTGSDALGIQTRARVPDLPELAERLLAAYNDTTYRERFDFIDHLRREKQPSRIRQLEATLTEALATREIDDVHLAAPVTLNWLDLEGFTFSRRGPGDEQDPDSDPRISGYLDAREGEDITVELLKRDQLYAISSSSGMPLDHWPIYRSLVYQVEQDGLLHVLSAGDWFRVDLNYRDRVYAEVNALPRFAGLPDAPTGTKEDPYNTMAAAHLGALCLDKQLIRDADGDSIEICDILTAAGGLIHVKLRGSSSTLSHLFAQGTNSAERLLLDAQFRATARAVIQAIDPAFESLISSSRPDPARHEITFAVITRSTRSTPLTLPFFSVVSLRAAARRLDAFGFKVSVAAVPER